MKALAYGVGKGVIADRSYNTIAEVTAGNGYAADIHEFKVDNNGDALIAIYQPIIPEGWTPTSGEPRLIDAIIQRIDIKTGLVKWEWHALGNIPIEDGHVPPTNGFLDPFHINSIEGQKDGTVITSMRDTCAIYKVDEETGQIVWTLGGNSSSFAMGPGATFCFQHDARMLSKNRISLFDDEAGPPVLAQTSRGLILNLDARRMTATVANEYVRPQNTLANSEGSVQKLKDGDVFVGFGSEPNFSQFSFDGTMNFDAALPVDDGSYRALRGEWDAKPQTTPDAAAVRTSPSHVTVYASWNGATRVASWRVLAGNSTTPLSPAGAAAWSGFETSIPVSTTADTFKVQALNARGKVLATSAAAIAP